MSETTIAWDERPLVPAIIQHADSGQVLMMAFMNRESFEKTLETGQVWFWSRTRQELWHKGATSGHYLNVRAITLDCDGDVLLVKVSPEGPACHTNATSCFFQEIVPFDGKEGVAQASRELWDTIQQRIQERPEGSYVAELVAGGLDRIARKIGEEATETVIAAKNRDRDELIREMADLWFHAYVLLAEAGLEPENVWEELRRRRR